MLLQTVETSPKKPVERREVSGRSLAGLCLCIMACRLSLRSVDYFLCYAEAFIVWCNLLFLFLLSRLFEVLTPLSPPPKKNKKKNHCPKFVKEFSLLSLEVSYPMVLNPFQIDFFLGGGGLNSGFWSCKAGTLTLQSHLQSWIHLFI
jgi:hypothetical protein